MQNPAAPLNEQELLPLCQLSVDRAVMDLRRGFTVLVRQGNKTVLAAAAEFTESALDHLQRMTPGKTVHLVLSGVRARALGMQVKQAGAQSLKLPQMETQLLKDIIDPLQFGAKNKVLPAGLAAQPASAEAQAALQLAKLGSLLPAVLIVEMADQRESEALKETYAVLCVEATKVERYREALAATLMPVSRARVPLREAAEAEVLAFRPRLGVIEHLAVLVGKPKDQPLVRMHSSCMTGDILASLRCDCGQQLTEALRRMQEAGSGILLYLNQEGRGIGIANKLRAYALQDAGLDTVEANEEIGFDADERHYQPAAEMLKQLGFTKIRMMTNNPDKVKELGRYGITVTERVPLVIEAGEHNRNYLATKAKKCGHIL